MSVQFKVRHRPMAIYLRYEEPVDMVGTEVLWRADLGSKMWAHEPGRRGWCVEMNSPRVTARTSFRITDFGIYAMTRILLAVGKGEIRWQDIAVTTKDCDLDGHKGQLISIQHTAYDPRQHLFREAILAIDTEWHLPVHAGVWARDFRTGAVQTVYCCTFSQLRVNSGLTDGDFDHRNPQYRFR